MTRHKVARVDVGPYGQSWDVLEGETIGPMPVSQVWDRVTPGEWKAISPFFQPAELACKGTGGLYVYVPALRAYNALRAEGWLRAHSPSSAFRSPAHNVSVGGGKTSRHLAGAAFDVPRIAIIDKSAFVDRARALGFNGVGFYRSFVHIDFRAKPAQWGSA